MFEIGQFEECISFYNTFCLDYNWEHLADVPADQIDAYFYRNQHQKLFQHSRMYAAVIGSHLAMNHYNEAMSLYKEMEFWGVIPLRDTYYHFIEVKSL